MPCCTFLGEEALVKIRINIFLTLPSPTMVSVILSEFEYHLLISTWTKIVIFHAITGLRAIVFCRLFQINLQFQLLQELVNSQTFHA